MTKFALISHILPPSPSGQAVMLFRILSGLNGSDYYLINTREGENPGRNDLDDKFRLEGRYYFLPPEPKFIPRHSYFGLSRIRKIFNVFTKFYMRTKGILDVLRQEMDTGAMVVCTGDFMDIPAGYVVSRIRGIPFYAYIFDDYVYQFLGLQRWFAKLIGRHVFKHSAGIIGPNEFICQEYKRRYQVATALVRNPCEKTELAREPYPPAYGQKRKIKIIYTGAVYLANFGCFRNLIQAMKSLSEHSLELHIFTAQTSDQLADEGIQSENTFVHSHLPYREILEQQRKSDILFLPLAFVSPIPEIIRTSAPGKLGEYLASGRPVLAHVPADSFVAHYLEKNQCGLVASQNNPANLKDHILKLINNEGYCRAITLHGRQRAQLDFDPDVARAALIDFLSVSLHRNPG
jgi:glycosyltransferase involved in cell wall biosynthesis